MCLIVQGLMLASFFHSMDSHTSFYVSYYAIAYPMSRLKNTLPFHVNYNAIAYAVSRMHCPKKCNQIHKHDDQDLLLYDEDLKCIKPMH